MLWHFIKSCVARVHSVASNRQILASYYEGSADTI